MTHRPFVKIGQSMLPQKSSPRQFRVGRCGAYRHTTLLVTQIGAGIASDESQGNHVLNDQVQQFSPLG
jgi:hypothetical protein